MATTTKDSKFDLSAIVVNALIDSPLYTPIVAQARKTMVKTATSVGVDWEGKYDLIKQAKPWAEVIEATRKEKGADFKPPKYYVEKFHGYAEGNLCIEAAFEQELAGKAVGARNFPNYGLDGEDHLRGCYETELKNLGGSVLSPNSICVDFGCGTGTSTRRLAKMFPQAKKIIGIDLSPEMVSVGRFLLNEASNNPSFEWVEPIEKEPRIEFRYGDIADTGLPDNSVGFVNLCLVLHELPQEATRSILKEAYRILAPGGTLGIMEMDPQAPGYVKLMSTPWLFAILKSTEPYLGEYFDLAPTLPSVLRDTGFSVVRTSAATGRHLAAVAIKGGEVDVRPSDEERAKSDMHLNTMQKEVATSK
jgi:ubiquinone/menaquinone biosynthesis C-methylase UbiE